MAIYSYSTFLQARQQIATRLYDAGEVFWSDSELKQYVWEALHTFNALTNFWRADFLFPPGAAGIGQTWWDLTSIAQMPNTLRQITLNDRSIYTIIQYHLLEPVAWNPWTGSSLQFSAQDLVNAVNRRQDEILSLTGCSITRATTPATIGRITLPDSVIDIRRLAYLPAGPSNTPSVVWPDDAWSEQAFNRTYIQQSPSTPTMYIASSQPPISFDTTPPPGFAGSYETLTVNSGGTMSIPITTGLSIPDDWSWVLKWGAMADLLSRESNAKDIPRAAYCESRYRMGVKLLTNASALLQFRADNVPVQIDSVRAEDLYNTGWQAAANGPTTALLTAGLNLIALSPAPDLSTYSYTVTCVQNAPLPVADGDPIQVSRDDYDAIIDYAQHLAAFKMGGEEFTRSITLFQRFLAQCATYGLKLSEYAEYTSTIFAQSHGEEDTNPRMAPAGADGGAA